MSYGPFTTANYLTTASTPVTAVPLTLACRFNSTDITVAQELVAVTNSADGDMYFLLRAEGAVAGDPVRAVTTTAGTARIAASTTGFSANTWHAAMAVFASATSRAAYIDGGSKGTNTNTSTPTGLNQIRIGTGLSTTEAVRNPLLGQIAEVAVWNAALTDAEAASHAKGVSPLLIRPQSLVFYAPLIRNLQDVRAGLTITMTGSVAVADHPRVYGL